MKKKIKYMVIVIFIFTAILIYIHDKVYGTKPEYINGMPGSVVVGTDENGRFIERENIGVSTTRTKKIIKRMFLMGGINIILTSILYIISVKTKVFQSKKDIVLLIFILIIPLVLCYFRICEAIIVAV